MFQIGNEYDSKIFEPLISMMEKKALPINRYRKAVGDGKSQCFGIVKQRNSRYAGSRMNLERMDIYDELIKLANSILPADFQYLSIQVNQNCQTNAHKDNGNVGLSAIIGFGDYSEGDLVVEDIPVSIKNRIVFFDGSLYTHWTKPFTGNRYSIVYHTPNRIFKTIPSYTVEHNDKGNLRLREQRNDLIRFWSKPGACEYSSDGVLPVVQSRKPSLLECIE